MIGRLQVQDHVLTLEDDLTWTQDGNGIMAEFFNLLYSADEYPGPSAGSPGHYLFYLAVESRGAIILDAPKPTEGEPRRVY